MIPSGRATRAFRVLTPAERMNLILHSLRRDEEPDGMVRWTLPQAQVDEFNRLLHLMTETMLELGSMTRLQDALLVQVEILAAVTHDLEAAGSIAKHAMECLTIGVPELLTFEQAAARIEEDGRELIPVEEAVDLVAEMIGVTLPAASKLLRNRVKNGNVAYAGVCEVAGLHPEVRPEWGAAAVVVSAEEDLELFRRSRDALRDDLINLAVQSAEARIEGLKEQVREGLVVRMTDVAVIQGVAQLIGEEFQGEPPLFIEDESLLEQIEARIERLGQEFGPIEVPDTTAAIERLAAALKERARLV